MSVFDSSFPDTMKSSIESHGELTWPQAAARVSGNLSICAGGGVPSARRAEGQIRLSSTGLGLYTIEFILGPGEEMFTGIHVRSEDGPHAGSFSRFAISDEFPEEFRATDTDGADLGMKLDPGEVELVHFFIGNKVSDRFQNPRVDVDSFWLR